MTKKNQKIIMGTCNPDESNLAKVAFDTETGFYYAMDGYRLVRVEMTEFCGAEIPVFDDNDKVVLPNYKRYVEQANTTNYTMVEIPYTVAQIKKWRSANLKRKESLPFTFGIRINNPYRKVWFGINPKFLTDAMETTGNNRIYIPEKGSNFFMEGNGYLWIICAVECKDSFKSNHSMTEIPEEILV